METIMTSDRDRVRSLNDALRKHHRGGRIVITRGIQALGAEAILKIDQAIAAFDAFTADNTLTASTISAPSRSTGR
jgi:hypothetical protein